MTKKLTISIPDTLFARLNNYRKIFSISGICANALKDEMDKHDVCVMKAKERLKLLTDSEKHKRAYEEGRQWAANEASLEDLAIVCLWEYDDDDASKLLFALGDNDQNIKKRIEGWSNVLELAMNCFMSETVLTKSDTDFFYENHEVAFDFIDGAKEIWRKIQNEAMLALLNSER